MQKYQSTKPRTNMLSLEIGCGQSTNHPIRIDFFGDEIDDLALFTVSDQRTFETLKSIEIYPVRELLIDNRAQINEDVIQEAFVDSPNRDIIGMILDHQGSSKDMIRSILERVKDARLKAWIKDRGDL